MTEDIEFETYIKISPKIIGIYVFDKKKFKNLFYKEINNEINQDNINLELLIKFLEENIFKIENLIGTFVKNISLIIENEKIFNLNFSLKKKNYERIINLSLIENILTEAKDLFKENYQDQKIIHMSIENFLVDGHRYSKITNDVKCDNLCLEVKFISISNDFIFEIEKVLERYQIKIIKSLNENYIRSLFRHNEIELSLMAHKVQLGYNENEVHIIPKNLKKSGFFEKFFQLFS